MSKCMTPEQKEFYDSLNVGDFLLYDSKEVLVITDIPFPGQSTGTFKDSKWTGQIWYPPNFRMFKKTTYSVYLEYTYRHLINELRFFNHLNSEDVMSITDLLNFAGKIND